MRTSMRTALAAVAGAALLAGCAAGPYYGNDYGYGYNAYDTPYYGYPGYGYVEPSVGIGIGFSGVERFDGDRRGHEWREHEHHGDWHRDGDRDGDHHH